MLARPSGWPQPTPRYPDCFDSLDHARNWARAFFTLNNHKRLHTSLGLMTPAAVHYGQADKVRAKRQHVLDEAYATHPKRFVKGRPIAPKAPDHVWINHSQPTTDSGVASTAPQPGAETT